ncbi:MFS family permease [Staphylococcus auricularis]|nr:MFS transporter [Staphylococcus auricularis]MBM0868950.1 MFS transporter [Staphylococcus auricularis]MCG7341428.1 MFS transporter [Staphylococcus auricularis]HJE01780.1 MFS transporter [Staphylococcus auricularis]
MKNFDISISNIYKLLYGRVLTNIGDSIILISLTWYVATQYHNTFYLGLIGVIVGIIDILMIFIGPILDRYNTVKILYFSTFLQIIIVIGMTLLFYFNIVHLIGLFLLLSVSLVCSSVIYPAENVLIPKISKSKEEIMKHNSLFQVTYKGMDIVLDGMVGVILSVLMIQTLFTINIAIFVVAFFMFKLLKLKSTNVNQDDQKNKPNPTFFEDYIQDLKDGLHYVAHKTILKLLIPLSIVNFAISAVAVVYPKMAVAQGHDSINYGLMLFINGLGMIVGFLIGPTIIKRLNFSHLLFVNFVCLGLVWLVIFVISPNYFLVTLSLLFISNLFIGIINLTFINAFQILPPEHMLGRVATTNETLLSLLMPLGAFIGGILPNLFETINVNFILLSLMSIVIAIFYLLDKDMRQIKSLNHMEIES